MRVTQQRRAFAAAIVGLSVVAAACGSTETAKTKTTRGEQSTTSAKAHDMEHEAGSHDSTAHDGGHDTDHSGTDSTGSHDGGHDGGHSGTDSSGASHDGGHDGTDSTGGSHDGGHDTDHSGTDSTSGSHDGGHDGDHSGTTIGGQGGSTTTGHGSHSGGHGGGTTTTGHGSHGGGTTTTGHGSHGGGSTTTTDPCATGGSTTTTAHGSHGGHGGGGSCGPAPLQYDDLDPIVQAGIDAGLRVAMRYPTAADAQAAGWAQSTVYFPGIAQHNLRAGWLDGVFDPAKPEVLLYGSDGKLVGINYIVYNGATPPDGFPGTDDMWHEHPALCRSYSTGLVIGGETLTDAECAAIGGYMFSFAGFYLLHVWAVPGYESPEGIFSHENSLLT